MTLANTVLQSPRDDRRSSRDLAWRVSAAWAAVLAPAAALTWAAGPLGSGRAAAALALAASPALAALSGTALGQAGGRLAVLAWALLAGLAAVLGGGVAGPFSVFCLTPLMAALMLRRADLLALAAAASLGALALSAFAAMVASVPPPPAALAPWLAMLALAAVAGGLGGALLVVHGEAARAGRMAAKLQGVFVDQPQLLLAVAPDGRMEAVVGRAPAGVRLADMTRHNLITAVSQPERFAVQGALRRAAIEGAAEIGFTPSGDPEGWVVLSLRRASQDRLVGSMREARAQHDRELELERARAQAESQNAGKSRFLANMSHELRTPLNAIMGFSDIMRQRLFGPMSDRYAEYAELVHESGGHLLELINDVLDMSKIEAERFELAREEFDAREAISAVLRLMRGQADRAGVQLRGVLPREPLDVDADRRALKQIALNLVSNALKFTPKGGSVTLTVQAAAGVLELVVADSGVGISPEDLERIGKPFEQAGGAELRAAGTGLGLSLVRAFAELHGGTMVIESRLGEGTSVTVRLPVLVP